MKKIGLVVLTFALLGFNLVSHAQAIAPPATAAGNFTSVNWVSKNTTDSVTIQSENGVAIVVDITVNPSPSSGVTVKNCGSTTSIKAGGAAICTSNSANPVTFASDNSSVPASGTYQIKGQ